MPTKKPKKYTLELHENGRGVHGPGGSGEVIEYRVGGMPAGEFVIITNFMCHNDRDWRVVRERRDEWTGNFQSPQDALAWLQGEVDKEQAN